ncbi:MAG TPA: polyphosphate kinase 2 family protein [Thermoanaerobaculia bacterium]|nr:polyphosphate kinase 2 family protein [Thermoanaerobaculia bacterium]
MKRMDRHRVKPGSRVELARHDPGSTGGFRGGKKKAAAELQRLNERLEVLQELLWAEREHKVLVVLQGLDASGKDGTIRHVFEGVNPAGVRVASFRVPTPDELAHDFLWRVHPKVPGRGELVIFNRSHYEDVLAVRVLELAPRAVWEPRFEQIVAFEKLLADTGTTVLKFFLHIDAEEQRERFQARVDDPTKRWKFNPGDLDTRKLWERYVEAYEDALSRTATDFAPWYVVPANKKWYRNLIVATVLVETLAGLDMRYPPGEPGLEGLVVE